MIRTPQARLIVAVAGFLLAGAALAASIGARPAAAHGTTQEPASRTYACRFESPDNAMCAAAWSANSQALYDWMEVNIGDAGGRHQELIPDGQLCSAGRTKYGAFDQPGAWPVTALRTGQSGHVDLVYENTAPHATAYYRVYLTRAGFDARTDLLGWSDLELAFDSGPLASAPSNRLQVPLPSRNVPAILYVVWQRSDSPEAFYACSDVTVDGNTIEPAPTTSTMPPATSAPVTSAPTTAAPSTTTPTTAPPPTVASPPPPSAPPPSAPPPTLSSTTVAPGTASSSTTFTTTSATPSTSSTAVAGVGPSASDPGSGRDTSAAEAETGPATSLAGALVGSSEEPTPGATTTDGVSTSAQAQDDNALASVREPAADTSAGASQTTGETAAHKSPGSSNRNRWLQIIGSAGVISSGLLLLGTRLWASGRDIWAGTVSRMLADGA